MQISKIKLKEGWLAVKKNLDEKTTAGGLILEEGETDFIVFGEIIVSGSETYLQGKKVLFNVIEAESFRDGPDTYFLVHESKIKGEYAK